MTDLLTGEHTEPPDEIVLDLDATDFELHGGQERRFYHGYYKEYCYLPLLVFCGRQPVMVRLRTASEEPASGIEKDLDALTARIRQRWPETRIILRTDSGFCRDPILSWCERTEGVDYVIGLAQNPRLQGRIADAVRRPGSRAAVSGKPSRRFRSFRYRTRSSWSRSRRVIAKAEALPEKGGGNQGQSPLHRHLAAGSQRIRGRFCTKGSAARGETRRTGSRRRRPTCSLSAARPICSAPTRSGSTSRPSRICCTTGWPGLSRAESQTEPPLEESWPGRCRKRCACGS